MREPTARGLSNTWIQPGHVHVWRFVPEAYEKDFSLLWETLDATERLRAQRFGTIALQTRFVACHGVVRMVLGRYLHVEPKAVQFICGDYGKPFVKPSAQETTPSFSLSHTSDMALCAVSDRRVGVDLERINEDSDFQALTCFLSPGEWEYLASAPAIDRPRRFFHLWTMREAYLKGRGVGLSMLEQVGLQVKDGVVANPIDEAAKPDERWSLRELDVGPHHAAALAVEGGAIDVNLIDWPGEDLPTKNA